jgi:hypothetical protein
VSVLAPERLIAPTWRELPHDPARIAALRKELDGIGYVALERFLTDGARDELKEQILALEATAESGHGKYAIKGEALDPTVVGELARSQWMLDFVNTLLAVQPAITDDPIRPDEIIPGINVMRTTSDVTPFHFDGTFLNLLLAVVIPKIEGPRRGQLVIYPNIRSFGRGFWQRKVVNALARSSVTRRLWKRHEIDYEEGWLYLFYGYRSLHGVEAQSEAALRCTTNMTIGQPRFRH